MLGSVQPAAVNASAMLPPELQPTTVAGAKATCSGIATASATWRR
ncbi:hypothetical protein N4G65_35685 [Streptomyces fulvoviolaceus]|nr:hypothetical protein [Streptomyces fulvoviolaceus]MCT9081838.1 hypothetical protein [Streptomyces fulvoviolaceus]